MQLIPFTLAGAMSRGADGTTQAVPVDEVPIEKLVNRDDSNASP
jgi:hypothetical protein